MIINSNLSALNTLNHLNRSNRKAFKSSEMLSSSSSINRAADNAAGLSISEKMRGQIRGLQRAQQNIQDGISLVQTAEGAMAEVHSILQRVRELSVQSTNDTHTSEDREIIQNEVNQLISEIDEIANRTEFNGMPLLAGRYDIDGNYLEKDALINNVAYITESNGINDTYTYDDGTDYASAIIDFSNITSADDVKHVVGAGVHYTCPTCTKAYSIKFVDGEPDLSRVNDYNPVMEVNVSAITNGKDLVDEIMEQAYGSASYKHDPSTNLGDLPDSATEFVKHFSQLAVADSKIFIYDNRPNYAGTQFPSAGGNGVFEPSVFGEQEPNLFVHLKIQDGSNTDDNFDLSIPSITVSQLGLEKLTVNTQQDANAALQKVDEALNQLSTHRATLGHYQNKMEHALNYVSNSAVNLTDAESRIRDTNMATEIMNHTKTNLITQSARIILAQSSQQQQIVLQLLQ